jgi:hypothetical protein
MVADPGCYGLSGMGRTVLRIHWARIERGLPRFASASASYVRVSAFCREQPLDPAQDPVAVVIFDVTKAECEPDQSPLLVRIRGSWYKLATLSSNDIIRVGPSIRRPPT